MQGFQAQHVHRKLVQNKSLNVCVSARYLGPQIAYNSSGKIEVWA